MVLLQWSNCSKQSAFPFCAMFASTAGRRSVKTYLEGKSVLLWLWYENNLKSCKIEIKSIPIARLMIENNHKKDMSILGFSGNNINSIYRKKKSATPHFFCLPRDPYRQFNSWSYQTVKTKKTRSIHLSRIRCANLLSVDSVSSSVRQKVRRFINLISSSSGTDLWQPSWTYRNGRRAELRAEQKTGTDI